MLMMTRTALFAFLCVWFTIVTGQRDDLSRLKEQGLTEEHFKSLTFEGIMGNLLPQITQNRAANLMRLPSNKTLVELDIMMTNEQLEQIRPTRKGRTKRKAVRNTVYRWPEGRMPFEILEGRNQLTSYDRFMMNVSMREWEKYTCVRFHQKRPEDRNYVKIRDGAGCNSQLGMVGGAQDLNLDKAGCRFKGLYLHEIGHALGLIHEHQRPIRDDWIEIVKKNVQPNMLIWFDKYNTNFVEKFDVDYEYSSVMHYGITAFSKKENGKALQTIRAKRSGREDEIGRVYLKELAFSDIKSINRMYKCDRFCRPEDPNTPVCTNGGFLDQNCKCICKDGSSDCTAGKIVDRRCTNDHDDWQCSVWAKQGECENNANFMTKSCKKACGICGDAFDDYDEFKGGVCDDLYDRDTCKKWKDNYDCVINKQWMKQNCKRTCGLCDPNKPPPGTSCRNKYENDEKCEGWAKKGECSINPRWMPQNCQKACHTCPEDGQSGGEKDPFDGRTRRPTRPTVPAATSPSRITTTPRTTPTPTPTTTMDPIGGGCVNRHDQKDCDIWAKHNHCNINPGWMGLMCKRSCGLCEEEEKETRCKNENPSCEFWAQHRQCVVNPGYMHVKCRKACRRCSKEFLAEEGRLQNDDPNAGSNSVTTDTTGTDFINMSTSLRASTGFLTLVAVLVGLLG